MRLSALNASTGGLLERGARLKPLILAALALQALVAVAMIASVADGGTLTDPSLSSRKLLQAPGPPGPQAKPPQQAPPLPPGDAGLLPAFLAGETGLVIESPIDPATLLTPVQSIGFYVGNVGKSLQFTLLAGLLFRRCVGSNPVQLLPLPHHR
mmetsp:Transcript_13774/g.31495  ORF Transcript_13774/g.31495 Transcript_13774/m.31495 type:complete len:154 (+) Transcript_13774:337-798(+)